MAITVVTLVIVTLCTVRYWILPVLWKPTTKPDDNQDECLAGGSGSHLSATEHSPSGVVRVIGLTDDGEFANRCELTDAIYEIRNCKVPELIVWYVHGWKHNADQDDTDFCAFKNLIMELDEQQRSFGEGVRRHVVGVYVGWDGAVGPVSLRGLTFWNRKRAADRISQSSVLTKIFAATKYAREQAGRDITAKDLTIMIGHSFGARMLYTATSQVLIDAVQREHPGYKGSTYGEIKGPADLILLLNPAFEASVFTAMHSIRRPDSKRWERIHPDQQPLLLVIASENDWATRKAFPLGQRLEFARRDRQRLTLGNYEKYHTHILQAAPSSDGSTTSNEFWYDRFEAAKLLLMRTADRQPGNPFLVATTTPDIIDGHNGIWGGGLRRWIVGFLRELHHRRLRSSEAQQ